MAGSRRADVDSAATLAAIVASSDDAIVSKTLEGVITSWNAAAERLFGYSSAEAIGQPVLMIIPPERQAEETHVLQKIRSGEKVEHFETERVAKGGRRIPISLTVSPIRDSTGTIIGASKIARDLREQKRLDEAQATLAAIVASSDDAIVSKTLDGVITSWNAGAEQLFGYSAAEAIGQLVLMIIPPERHSEERQVLDSIRRGERVEHFETERVTKGGRLIPISLTVSPVRDAGGRVIGASKIARDISLKRELEAERLRALAIAETASRSKDEFLAMFGHELRNPLAAVNAAAESLDRVTNLDELTQLRLVLKRQARHLRRLVDDLFDASRVRAGKISLEQKPIDLADAVERAIGVLQSSPLPPSQALETRYERVGVLADPVRLEQMLLNLLSNAIKYTPPDRTIRLEVREEGGWGVLSVEDEGVGIASDVLPHIFELFVQGRPSIDRSTGGLGIGLSLVKTLAELHGGMVEAESEGPGTGSRFTLRLPRISLGEANERAVVASALPQGLRILIVEDNRDAREMLALYLRYEGHDVHEAADGGEAVRLAESLEPEIVLVDIGLPLIDGYEVARQIRRMAFQPRRLIALTGYGQPEDRRKCLAAGFDDHVVKPIDVEQLGVLLRGAQPQVSAGGSG